MTIIHDFLIILMITALFLVGAWVVYLIKHYRKNKPPSQGIYRIEYIDSETVKLTKL